MNSSWLTKIAKDAPPKPMALPFNEHPWENRRGIDRIDDRMTQETADQIKKQFNPEYLSAGDFGIAATTDRLIISPDKKNVIKICSDWEEAVAAITFGRSPCCAKVIRAGQIQKKPELYIIVMEMVTPLTDPIERNATGFLRYILEKHISEEYYEQRIAEAYMRYPTITKFIEKYRRFADCFRQNKINSDDAHANNIGYDKQGNLVIFDYGGVSSPTSLPNIFNEET